MTEEGLVELRSRLDKADGISRHIEELKKIIINSKNVKIWGVCFYYDEECDNKMYLDLPLEDMDRFIKEFVLRNIELLEKEFAAI
jgi:hypothetical protein